MYGIVTRSAETALWDDVDRVVFEAKDATGRSRDPIPNAVNAITCFADAAAIEGGGDVVAVDSEGQPARPDPTVVPGDGEEAAGSWNYVCPTHPDYREGLLEAISAATAVSPDVRLDEAGFPGREFCHCERCDRRFDEHGTEDRAIWRHGVITDFLVRARDRVPGDLSLAVHPDPYPDHLADRSGIHLSTVAESFEEIVVPLYDPHYATTHWMETIASGFADRLRGVEDFDGRLAIELFADAPVDAVSRATDAVEPYADAVYFGYDDATARALLRRRRAVGSGPGTTYGPG